MRLAAGKRALRRMGAAALAGLLVAVFAGGASARTVSVASLQAELARVTRMPVLGGVVRLTDAAFAGPELGAVVGQTCPQTASTACRGFVARTSNGGKTWTQTVLADFTASSVALAPDGRTWVWLQGLGCSTGGACTSELLTAPRARSTFHAVLTAKATPAGLLANSAGVALIALDACPGPNGKGNQCRGRLLATNDAGGTWRTAWQGDDWVGGLAAGGARVWALAARGVGVYGSVRMTSLVGNIAGGGFRAAGLISTAPNAGGLSEGLSADEAWAPDGRVWLAVSDTPECAMHGCSLSGLYRSVDRGRTWQAASWPAAAGGCSMPGPLVVAWGTSILAAMHHNLAACAPPATVLVAAGTDDDQTTVVSRLPTAFVGALGVVAPGRVWAVTSSSLLASTDGGRRWQPLWPAPAPTLEVQFVTRTEGLGVGTAASPGDVLATTDGGRTWRPVGHVPLGAVSALEVLTSRVAYVAGSSTFPYGNFSDIWRTANGGATWHKVAGVEGTVIAMRLSRLGAGWLVTSALGGDATKLLRITPGRRLPSTLELVGQAPNSAAFGPLRRAYLATTSAPGGGTVMALSPGRQSTLAALPPDSEAEISPAGGGVAAALSITITPTRGSRLVGYAQRTEVLVCARGTWRLVRLPEAAGAPVAIDFLNGTDGWLLTDGLPGAAVLWQTSDGGRSWAAVTP